MEKIFITKDGVVRLGWRVIAYLFGYLIFAGALIFLSTILLSQIAFGASATGYLALIIPLAASSIISIVLGWVAGRIFERLPSKALGISPLKGWFKSLALGGVVGSVALASAVLVSVMGGGLSLAINHDSSGVAIAGTLWTTFVIFAVGALSEEALFRGYLFQTFIRSRMLVPGAVLTSLFFAFVHNNNPGASLLSFVNTLLAGLWFAEAYLKTRDLWFPVGIHLMWNWLQGPVFGINVSGISEFSPDPILRTMDHGPAILTGGSYGIEGGIACTIAISISIGLIYFLPIKPDEELLALSSPQKPKLSGS